MTSQNLCDVSTAWLKDPSAEEADDGRRPVLLVDFKRKNVQTHGQLFAKVFALGTDQTTGARRVIMTPVREWNMLTIPTGEPVWAGHMFAHQMSGDDVQRSGKFLACCEQTLGRNPRMDDMEWQTRALKAVRPLFYKPAAGEEEEGERCCVIL